MAELDANAPYEPAAVEYGWAQLAGLQREGPVPMTDPNSLNLNGAYARVFYEPEMGSLEERVRFCLASWFRQTLALNLDKRPRMYRVNEQQVALGLNEWDALSRPEQGLLLDLFDLSTDSGMEFAHNRSLIAGALQFRHVSSALRYALEKTAGFTMSGSGFPMSSSATGWWKNGFGFWAYLVTPECLLVTQRVMRDMQERGLYPGVPKHYPHLIYKPVRGAALGAHHDQFSPAQLLNELDALLGPSHAERPVTTTDWVARHGLQSLAHFSGGVGPRDGATFVVGPMPPSKLRFCLRAFAEGRVPGQRAGEGAAWLAKPKGKVDLDWPRLLPGFNQMLGAAGHSEIGLLAIVPPLDEAVGTSCVEVTFPRGWPHGTFGMEGSHTRLTTTVPLSIAGSSEILDDDPADAATLARIRQRLYHMADLSSNGLTREQYRAAEDWLALDLRPYATGLTHKAPHLFCSMIRSRDAAVALGLPAGHFGPLCASRTDVQRYYQHVALYCGDAPAGPSAPPNPPAPLDLPALPHPGPSDSETPYFPDPFAEPLRAPDAPSALESQGAAKAPKPPEQFDPYERESFSRCPPPGVLDKNLLILKVHQPWASALMGIKDVENRKWPLVEGSGWVVIASTIKPPSSELLWDLRARIRRDPSLGHPDRAMPRGAMSHIPHFTDNLNYNIFQHIIGLVYVTKCARKSDAPWASVWHNKGDLGWYISHHWALETPIPLAHNDGFQTKVRLVERPRYREALKLACEREQGAGADAGHGQV